MDSAATPGLKDIRFGIEIETQGVGNKLKLAQAVAAAIGGAAMGDSSNARVRLLDGREWQVVYDGSLGERGAELVSPILTYADLEMVQEIIRAAREIGAHSSEATGIHIHIDGAAFTGKSLTNLVKLVAKQERLLEHALKVRTYRLQKYCKAIDGSFLARLEKLRNPTLAQVKTAWYGYDNAQPRRYDDTRYHGLNLNSMFFRGTIEFRYFNGSMRAGKVKAFIQLTLALAAKALKAKNASSKRRTFTAATAKYDFRVFLLGLGLIGDEFKTCRHHMLKGLEGSAAWKNGRPAVAATGTEG